LHSEYIHACYALKTPPNPIPAAHNFWGNIFNGTVYNVTTPAAHMSLCANCCDPDPCTSALGITTTPAFSLQPQGCKSENCPPGIACQEDCLVVTEGSITTRTQFMESYEKLLAENFEDARDGFAPVAALKGSTTAASATTICRTYIDAGKSLADANGYSGGEERNSLASGRFVRISPNPANREVMIRLPEGAYTLRVWNTFGILVSVNEVVEITRLDLSAWTLGLYVLEVVGADGKRETARLAVQR